jgi:hypothetical protein
MDVFFNSIKCIDCKHVLNSPVLLPCGHSICQDHVTSHGGSRGEYHCLECDTIHAIPSGGFIRNMALQSMLNANIQRVKFSQEYESAFASCKSFEKILADFKLYQTDPFYYINNTIGELKMETDLLREECKLKIDQKADEIIKELEKYEQTCAQHVNLKGHQLTKTTGELVQQMDDRLDKWKQCLATFDSDEDKWAKMKLECESQMAQLQVKLVEYKDSLLLGKFDEHRLKVTSFTKIKQLKPPHSEQKK